MYIGYRDIGYRGRNGKRIGFKVKGLGILGLNQGGKRNKQSNGNSGYTGTFGDVPYNKEILIVREDLGGPGRAHLLPPSLHQINFGFLPKKGPSSIRHF